MLGDWDFNLRFLSVADIAVVPEYLANYHVREKHEADPAANSITAQMGRHAEYSAIVRNSLVRRMAERGQTGLSSLVGLGLHFEALWNDVRTATREPRPLPDMAATPATRPTEQSDNLWVAAQCLAAIACSNNTSARDRTRWLLRAEPGEKPAIGGFKLPFGGDASPSSSWLNSLDTAATLGLLAASPLPPKLGAPPDFDEVAYLESHPDVHLAVQRGEFASGFDHYIRYGRGEGRARPGKPVR